MLHSPVSQQQSRSLHRVSSGMKPHKLSVQTISKHVPSTFITASHSSAMQQAPSLILTQTSPESEDQQLVAGGGHRDTAPHVPPLQETTAQGVSGQSSSVQQTPVSHTRLQQTSPAVQSPVVQQPPSAGITQKSPGGGHKET